MSAIPTMSSASSENINMDIGSDPMVGNVVEGNVDMEEKKTEMSDEVDSTSTLKAKTLNVKDFCTVVESMAKIPNLEHVYIEFDKTGMTIYAKPPSSPVLTHTFWSESMFSVLMCTSPVKKWVSKKRLDMIRKKLGKDIQHITFTEMENGAGFQISGEKQSKTGGMSDFYFNIAEWTCTVQPFQLNIEYNWHVTTSSEKFKENMDFMDETCEIISINLHGQQFTFDGIDGTGQTVASIGHKTDSFNNQLKFDALIYFKYLKIVSSAHSLHKSLNISFLKDKDDDVFPVLFSFTLDQTPPGSHFSVYILPLAEDETA